MKWGMHMLVTGGMSVWSMGEINWPFMAGALIGSILPDCDHKQAPMGKILPLHWFIKERPLSYIDRTGEQRTVMTKHRTITHSFAAVVVSGIISMFGGWKFALGISIGMLMHLFMDSTTTTKIPFLWFPLKR